MQAFFFVPKLENHFQEICIGYIIEFYSQRKEVEIYVVDFKKLKSQLR